MVKITYRGRQPDYIEDFPVDCERSNVGSMHLMPNVVNDITKDELNHIEIKHQNIYNDIIVHKIKDISIFSIKKSSSISKQSSIIEEPEIIDNIVDVEESEITDNNKVKKKKKKYNHKG